MERVDGFTPVGVLPPRTITRPDGASSRLRPGRRAGRTGPRAVAGPRAGRARPPGGVPRPAGTPLAVPARQLPDPGDIPGLDWIATWLEANRPPRRTAALMHGDFSPYQRHGVAGRHHAGSPPWWTGTPGRSATRCSISATCWPGGPNPARSRPSGSGTSRSGRACRPGRSSLARYAERTGARPHRAAVLPGAGAVQAGHHPGRLGGQAARRHRRGHECPDPPAGRRWWTGSSVTPACTPGGERNAPAARRAGSGDRQRTVRAEGPGGRGHRRQPGHRPGHRGRAGRGGRGRGHRQPQAGSLPGRRGGDQRQHRPGKPWRSISTPRAGTTATG